MIMQLPRGKLAFPFAPLASYGAKRARKMSGRAGQGGLSGSSGSAVSSPSESKKRVHHLQALDAPSVLKVFGKESLTTRHQRRPHDQRIPKRY